MSRIEIILKVSYMICEVCSAEMEELHCKLICKECGYKIDCSDL